jgi:hypothetical protein
MRKFNSTINALYSQNKVCPAPTIPPTSPYFTFSLHISLLSRLFPLFPFGKREERKRKKEKRKKKA